MEPAPGSEAEFRFTAEGMERREAILHREQERIERACHVIPERFELSDPAWELLRRRSSGEAVAVKCDNKEAYRELARAQIIYPVSGFVGGPESAFRFSFEGHDRRREWVTRPVGSP